MKEELKKKKAEYQKKFNETIPEYNRLGILLQQLEGAIMACDEILKELEERQ